MRRDHQINESASAVPPVDSLTIRWTPSYSQERYSLVLLVCGLLALLLTGCGLTDAEERYNSGVELLLAGRLNDSAAAFTEAIRLDPQDPTAFYARGVSYAALGQHSKALADYAKAIDISPKYADAYFSRGVSYSALKEYGKAITEFSAAIESDESHAAAYLSRGLAHAALQDHQGAITDFGKSIQLNPQKLCSIRPPRSLILSYRRT